MIIMIICECSSVLENNCFYLFLSCGLYNINNLISSSLTVCIIEKELHFKEGILTSILYGHYSCAEFT